MKNLGLFFKYFGVGCVVIAGFPILILLLIVLSPVIVPTMVGIEFLEEQKK